MFYFTYFDILMVSGVTLLAYGVVRWAKFGWMLWFAKVKSCPFCGDSPLDEDKEILIGEVGNTCHLICHSCQACSPTARIKGDSRRDHEWAHIKAVTFWNARE